MAPRSLLPYFTLLVAVTMVHPHVRGEHYMNENYVSEFVRFIPTCVGNTGHVYRAHFRVAGSSPRAWGTLCHVSTKWRRSPVHPHVRGEHSTDKRSIKLHLRFIPTCVGNTIVGVAAVVVLLGSITPPAPKRQSYEEK